VVKTFLFEIFFAAWCGNDDEYKSEINRHQKVYFCILIKSINHFAFGSKAFFLGLLKNREKMHKHKKKLGGKLKQFFSTIAI